MTSNLFQNAQNFTINNAQFVSNPQTFNYNTASGLDILLKASLPQAAHDSSERYPPPRCHPGTRQDYIAQIVQWSLNKEARVGRILWMQGPAGVGKSAVAQTVAETLEDRLGAAFFFSRLNSGDDPDCFFTTLSYQLATKMHALGDIIDQKIRRDPTLVTKAMPQQFEALIAAPVQELQNKGIDVGELVIIIDGLDECATMESQRDIIEIIAASVQKQSAPFLWIFFSRPEPHIITAFTLPHQLSLSFHLELPVSRDVDIEITQYLTDELANVRREHGLPLSWPSENDIGTLVKLSAGLFIYTATIVRFICAYDSLGPEDQLRLVLNLANKTIEVQSTHPLFELDSLYMLIMQRIPSRVLITTQKILIITSIESRNDAKMAANILNLSESQLRYAYRSLHSVLSLTCSNEEAPQNSELRAITLTFYHASFMEFLWDPRRSGKFCLRLECANTLRSDLLEKVNEIHENSKGNLPLEGPRIQLPLVWKTEDPSAVYLSLVRTLLILYRSIPLDDAASMALADFNFPMIPVLAPQNVIRIRHLEEPKSEQILNNIPKRPYRSLFFYRTGLVEKPSFASEDLPPYVIGSGKNKVICWHFDGDALQRDAMLTEYPRIRDFPKFVRDRLKKAQDNSESDASAIDDQ